MLELRGLIGRNLLELIANLRTIVVSNPLGADPKIREGLWLDIAIPWRSP